MSALKNFGKRITTFFHNLHYFTHRMFSYDHEQACRYMLHVGRKNPETNDQDWRHCPICGYELERTVQQGFIMPFCPRWQAHPRDTGELVMERQSVGIPTRVLKNLPVGTWRRIWNESPEMTQELPSLLSPKMGNAPETHPSEI